MYSGNNFWKIHDQLYACRAQLSKPLLLSILKKEHPTKEQKAQAQIYMEADAAAARALKLNATPTFFVFVNKTGKLYGPLNWSEAAFAIRKSE